MINSMSKSPSLTLYNELFDLWKKERYAGFVSNNEVVEVTKHDTATGSLGGNKRTASRSARSALLLPNA